MGNILLSIMASRTTLSKFISLSEWKHKMRRNSSNFLTVVNLSKCHADLFDKIEEKLPFTVVMRCCTSLRLMMIDDSIFGTRTRKFVYDLKWHAAVNVLPILC